MSTDLDPAQRALVLDARDLTEPVPLAPCPNRPEPGCGWCWLCLMRKHGFGPTQSLLDAFTEVVARPAKGKR